MCSMLEHTVSTSAKNQRLDEVIRLWQPRSTEKLTHADAAEILSSVGRLYKVLRRVHEEVQNAHANPPAQNL